MRISDWSSDVCSSDLASEPHHCTLQLFERANLDLAHAFAADAIDLAQFFQGFGIFRQAAFCQNVLFAFVKVGHGLYQHAVRTPASCASATRSSCSGPSSDSQSCHCPSPSSRIGTLSEVSPPIAMRRFMLTTSCSDTPRSVAIF